MRLLATQIQHRPLQEVEIALAEEAFQKDKAQLAEIWAQRTHQFQQAVDLQVMQCLSQAAHYCLAHRCHEQHGIPTKAI